MPRVPMNFDRYDDWFVHFIEAECRTTIRRRTRFIRALPQRGGFRTFVSRCNLEDMAEFDRTMGQWSRGSNYCHLTEEQYRTLL